jgi:hypothetical protein
MLTRLTATASAFILGAALAVALPPAAARADCTVKNGLVDCTASDADKRMGRHKGGKHGKGRDTGTGIGCPDQANGVPGLVCPIDAPNPVQRIPSIDLAWRARGDLGLPAPHVHWAPQPRTYVQLRTGLWVDRADFAEFSKSVSAGGQTVTATATPKRVEWGLVETTIQCQSAGSADGTACGYTYQRSSAAQPDGTYHITATITWSVNWTCQGACDPNAGGPLDPISMSSAAQLPVDEIQTETQPG